MSTPTPNFEIGTNGLLPAIAQDHRTGKVLMMAWMNQEAWQETIRSGRAVYYSRSRKKLWRKGEESGHVQKVEAVLVDCDADTILLQVHQSGAACHEGYPTCFFRQVDGESNGQTNFKIVEQRLKSPEEIYKK